MLNGFHRLRHDAVIGGHDQHDNVRHLRTARAHRAERSVARRVEEGDALAIGQANLIRADVLRDAASFAGHDIRLAQRIEQRGFAVVDVAHNGHDRRTRLGVLVGVDDVAGEALFNVRFRDAFNRVAVLGGDEFGGIRVELVALFQHLALAHHELDDVRNAHGHAVREFLNRDGFRDDDFANNTFGAAAHHLGAALFFFLLRTAIGRERTHAIVIARHFALDHVERQAAFAALRLALLGWLYGRYRQRLARRLHAATEFTQHVRTLLLLTRLLLLLRGSRSGRTRNRRSDARGLRLGLFSRTFEFAALGFKLCLLRFVFSGFLALRFFERAALIVFRLHALIARFAFG